jgi:hypothetical protein
LACVAVLLWLMLRTRPERKTGDAAASRERQLPTRLGSRIGYPGL